MILANPQKRHGSGSVSGVVANIKARLVKGYGHVKIGLKTDANLFFAPKSALRRPWSTANRLALRRWVA